MKSRILSIAVAFLSLTATAQVKIPMPKPGPSPVINLGKANEFKLNNGLNVIVVENHKLPRVSVTLTIDNPPFALGAKKGVEDVLSQMLGTGTIKVSKDDFNKKIEQMGARVNYSSGGGRASSLTKFFSETFSAFAEGAVHPKFTQEEFETVKTRILEEIKSSEKSVEAAAGRVEDALVYGKNHPFGEFETKESVEKLTLADVQNYYDTYYKPNNAYLVFIGDITAKEAKKLAEKHFKSWKKGNLNIPTFPAVSPVQKTSISVVDMPNAVQSVVSVAYPVNLTKKDPDYYAVQVASTILGGDFGSRLNMNLREKNAFTYGARGSVSDSRYIGQFHATATVRNAVSDAAVVETLKEMREMGKVKVDAKELENVKAKFLGNFILRLENPATTASQALTKKTHNLSDAFYTDYIKNINKVTPEDVQRVAQKYFRPEQAQVIVTGKASEIGDKLEKLGYPVQYYTAYAEKMEKPKAKKVDANITATSIAEKYINAIGGKARVEKVTSTKMNASATVQGMALDMTMIQAKGGKMKMEVKMMGNTMQKIVFDGKDGFQEAQGQKMPMNDEMKKKFSEEKEIFPELHFTNAKVEGQEKFNGEEAFAVKVGEKTNYYSVATGLKLGFVENMMGQAIPTYLSDYKEVNGVKFPHKISQNMGGMEIVFEVKSYELNKAKDADFK